MKTQTQKVEKTDSVRSYSKVVRQQFINVPRELVDFAIRYPSVDWNQVISDAAAKVRATSSSIPSG